MPLTLSTLDHAYAWVVSRLYEPHDICSAFIEEHVYKPFIEQAPSTEQASTDSF